MTYTMNIDAWYWWLESSLTTTSSLPVRYEYKLTPDGQDGMSK